MKASSNVYTVLMLTSIISLGAACGVIIWKHTELKNVPWYQADVWFQMPEADGDAG